LMGACGLFGRTMLMRPKRVPLCGVLLGAGVAVLWVWLGPRRGQEGDGNGFETLRTGGGERGGGAPSDRLGHQISDQGAHDGQRSEYLRLDAKFGTHIHYQYSTGRATISDELIAGVWLKASRPGVQLLARVVLPDERDPSNLDQRLTTIIRGDQ